MFLTNVFKYFYFKDVLTNQIDLPTAILQCLNYQLFIFCYLKPISLFLAVPNLELALVQNSGAMDYHIAHLEMTNKNQTVPYTPAFPMHI